MRNEPAQARHGKIRRSDPGTAFLSEGCVHTRVDLAEFLAEEFVASATSGDDVREDDRDRMTEADLGGPLVEEPENGQDE